MENILNYAMDIGGQLLISGAYTMVFAFQGNITTFSRIFHRVTHKKRKFA